MEGPQSGPKKYLFGLIKRDRRRTFLGTIRIRFTQGDEWIFKAYGRKNIKLVKQLAEEMASAFDVKINITLVKEESEVETYSSDYSI